MNLSYIVFFFELIVTAITAKRPYTTPSPYGSVHFKQLKCECTERMNELVYPNFTCYAKAYNRDVSVLSAYAKLKKPVYKIWLSGFLEYKYGTIYRSVIDVKQVPLCDILKVMEKTENILIQLIIKVLKQVLIPDMIHACPYKAEEEVYLYNFSFPVEQLPSLFSQGDYRARIFVYWPTEDEIICNDTVVLSSVSPIKESFG